VSPESSGYVVSFLKESLGLADGTLTADMVPPELAQLVVDAVRGSEASASPEPVLEQKVSAFRDEIEEIALDRHGFLVWKARWPGGAPYAACLTHDVDNISRPLGHVIGVRDRFSRADFLLAILGLKSLYNNIQYVASLEGAKSLRSSFYLLTANYDLSKIAAELRGLVDGGWEVGLHGDFGTHDSAERMSAAVKLFREKTGIDPRGLREHFLQFDYGKSWMVIDGQGFDYDTSVGNRDRLGFRLGMCTPFHPPDSEWRPMRTLELPLVLMDTTLWGYLKRTEEEGMRDFSALKDSVRRVGGLYTILWHQEALRMKGGRIYPRLLDALIADNCFFGSGANIARWWLDRAKPLVVRGNECSMDAPPEGLIVHFKAKEERKLSLDGGRVEMNSADAGLKASGSFKLKVE